MYLTVRGLVLRLTDYNDRDTLVTLLTADHGRMTVKARGLRRKNSPLIGPCQLLAYGEYTLFEYKGMYTINEAASLELFRDLRKSLSKLSLGTYMAQVCEVISQEDLPSPELLSLLLNCLYGLSKLDVSEAMVKSVFEFRCACLAGYMPELQGCIGCGNPIPERFDVSAGHLECVRCRSRESDGIRMPVTQGLLSAMRYIAFCDSKRLFSFSLSEEAMELLSQLTETYLITQLERSFSTLDFYKSLLI
jgi:DNA repair protein RecO (recombination protein O)